MTELGKLDIHPHQTQSHALRLCLTRRESSAEEFWHIAAAMENS